jgi:hypothetical protein
MPAEDLESLINSYEIPSWRATQYSEFGLENFSREDLKRILDSITPRPRIKGSNEPCGPLYYKWVGVPLWMHGLLWSMAITGMVLLLPFQSAATTIAFFTGRIRPAWREIPSPTFQLVSWARNMTAFIKAPLGLIKASIAQKAALCINRSGNFSVRESGYSVMSHVWGETMGWSSLTSWGQLHISLRKKGIAYDHFLRFFDRCESEWLWVDVISMPEVLEDMMQEQKDEIEALRVEIINCLHGIYTRADRVIVLDSLLLQLNTRSPVDVAVVLLLGSWRARLWPFVEARLSKQVMLKTKDFMFDLDDVLGFLDRAIHNTEHRYFPLFRRLMFLRESACLRFAPASALEIAFMGCENRHTNVEVDSVRVLFTLLNLEWENGFSLRDGLVKIVKTFPDEEEWVKRWCSYRSLEYPDIT